MRVGLLFLASHASSLARGGNTIEGFTPEFFERWKGGLALTRVLDSIPGAWERAELGRAQGAAGQTIPLDQRASNAPGTMRLSACLKRTGEAAGAPACFGLTLGRLSESHGDQRRLLDLPRGEPQGRSTVRLEPAPTALGKAINGVAVVTHVPQCSGGLPPSMTRTTIERIGVLHNGSRAAGVFRVTRLHRTPSVAAASYRDVCMIALVWCTAAPRLQPREAGS